MEILGNEENGFSRPWVIAGPCSAETYDQLYAVTKSVYKLGVKVVRAGVWKPRTRPNNFEGVGVEALAWMESIKKEIGVKFAIEVANAEHVELALKYNIDMAWLGARTTVNPFTVQEIADALKGTDIPVMVKNPVNPDLALWMGCIERIANAGIQEIAAIHRGFSSYKKTRFRNEPLWQLPIELKSRLPGVPLLCDPSHIAGDSSMIHEISQKALDLNYDGIMVETHPDPGNAWSDPKQQVSPGQLAEILKDLKLRQDTCDDSLFKSQLEELRNKIDSIDHDLVENLANRAKIIEEIGQYKKDNDVTILQIERWNKILKSRKEWGQPLGLNAEFIEELYKAIHSESIRKQTEIFNRTPQSPK